MFKTFVLVFISASAIVVQSTNETLLSVIVIFRHGERAPLNIYKNDPYDESYWPQGLGELTNKGKRRQYALGKWFRKRYDGFLPSTYNKKDITVLSSDRDRCLMSAASSLAGLYPPEGNQMWHQNLQWQPIPIHTLPVTQDFLLTKHRPCARYNKLYDELMKSDELKSFFQKNKDLLVYLANKSGEVLATIDQIRDLYDTLYVESIHNLTLPEWTHSVFPAKLKPLVHFGWSTHAYTTELAKLRSGPLVDYIVEHFDKIISRSENTAKFLMLSTHDSVLVNILNSLHAYYYHWPVYAATLVFELKTNGTNYFVNVLYKNTTETAKITLRECNFDCEFDDFKNIVEPVRINAADWEKECSQEL